VTFPAALRPELIRASLWSMDRAGNMQGVYSHSTVLELYGAPGAKTSELHMTVPPGFRRSAAAPLGVVLHVADVPASDIAARPGYRLTRPLRTILDLTAEGRMARAEMRETLLWMVDRKLIRPTEVKRARIAEGLKAQLEELMGWR
jgi:hypothetical protein